MLQIYLPGHLSLLGHLLLRLLGFGETPYTGFASVYALQCLTGKPNDKTVRTWQATERGAWPVKIFLCSIFIIPPLVSLLGCLFLRLFGFG